MWDTNIHAKYIDDFEDMFKFIQTSYFTRGKISVRMIVSKSHIKLATEE